MLAPRDRSLYVLFAAVCAVVVAAFTLLTWLGWRRSQALRSRTREVRRENQDLKDRIARVPQLARAVAGLRRAYEQGLVKLPPRPHQAALLKGIQNQVVNADVELLRYEIEPAASRSRKPAGPVREIAIRLAVRGSFFSIADFLTRLEHYPRLLRLEEGSFREIGDEPRREMLELTCRVTAFVRPDPTVRSRPQSWQAVAVPRARRTDPRMRNPFEVRLTPVDRRQPPPPAPGPAGREAALARLAAVERRFSSLVAAFRRGDEPTSLSAAWRELKAEVREASSAFPAAEKRRQALLRSLAVLEGPMVQRLARWHEERARRALVEAERFLRQGDFGPSAASFGAAVRALARARAAEGARARLLRGLPLFRTALDKLVLQGDHRGLGTALKGLQEVGVAGEDHNLFEAVRDLAQEYGEKARALADFQGMAVRVSGIIWTPGRDRRVAIVNGRGYGEGETIRVAGRDGRGRELTLAAVGRGTHVRFRYQGLIVRMKVGSAAWRTLNDG